MPIYYFLTSDRRFPKLYAFSLMKSVEMLGSSYVIFLPSCKFAAGISTLFYPTVYFLPNEGRKVF